MHESCWNGGGRDVQVRAYSITKSLTSILTAMAVDDRVLALDDPASEQVEQWRVGGSGDVAVRDLLAQVSGREWSEATDRQLIRGATDQTQYAVGLGQAGDPGEWVYDNAGPQVLERVLAGSMTSDLVSSRSVEQATTSATEDNAAYGLLWWTNISGRVVEARRQAGFDQDVAPYEGRLAPNVPADAFWAFRYGNQYIAVVPSENLVAVRLGARPASPDQVTFDTFTSGVLEALESS